MVTTVCFSGEKLYRQTNQCSGQNGLTHPCQYSRGTADHVHRDTNILPKRPSFSTALPCSNTSVGLQGLYQSGQYTDRPDEFVSGLLDYYLEVGFLEFGLRSFGEE